MLIRTIPAAAQELKRQDPGCSITASTIRQLCVQNIIPYRKAGTRYLVDVDIIRKHFDLEAGNQNPEERRNLKC